MGPRRERTTIPQADPRRGPVGSRRTPDPGAPARTLSRRGATDPRRGTGGPRVPGAGLPGPGHRADPGCRRFPGPGPQGDGPLGDAPVGGEAGPLFPRPTRDPGPDRLPPAHHPRRDRRHSRRRRQHPHRQDPDRARVDPQRRPPRRARPSGPLCHHPQVSGLLRAAFPQRPADPGGDPRP